MRKAILSACICSAFVLIASVACADSIRLATTPALSPDGEQLAFSWRGDLWLVSSEGGTAERLTSHPARDYAPVFSPDGKQLAFMSERTGSPQVFLMSLSDKTPVQWTFHTEGCLLEQWYPDGQSLLISADRDHFWKNAQRFFRIDARRRAAPELLFDGYGDDGRISPDGTKLLFTREYDKKWRKGYRGPRAEQVWMYDLKAKTFCKLIDDPSGARSPQWASKIDGGGFEGFYFTSEHAGSRNLWYYQMISQETCQLTHMTDDAVLMPSVSGDGSTIVFRHRFDLYCYQPGEKEPPKQLEINCPGDSLLDPILRRTLRNATGVAFSNDGLEIALIAGGDLWVMDTELREPRRITNTPEEEHDPVFAPDGKSILFVSDMDGQSDVWRATRADEERYWWENEHFNLSRVTLDPEHESELKWSPDGQRIALIKSRGSLWVMRPDGKERHCVTRSSQPVGFDWSPDGKWLVYGQDDAESNRDIWIAPVDGSREPVNISRHPDNDQQPVWSPDGKTIAFTGRRVGNEVDICFVYLTKDDEETNGHDRALDRAKSKMDKARGANKNKKSTESKEQKKGLSIDFEDIYQRVHRVSLPGTSENNLFWSHDSKKLVFTAKVAGKKGTYTISPPGNLKPQLLSMKTGVEARWLASGNQVVWLSGGTPGSLSASGAARSYPFSVVQTVDKAQRNKAAFDLCWRTMRDFYYDDAFGNHNWDEIRRKYSAVAAQCLTSDELVSVVNMMLGELNGSHLGFMTWDQIPSHLRMPGMPSAARDFAKPVTAHLGVRFDPKYRGPGLKVRDCIEGGPADRSKSRIRPGEIILSIDGQNVDPAMDLTEVLNGPSERDVKLVVRDQEGKSRDVTIRSIDYNKARGLLYEAWIRKTRQQVAKLSDGKLGYLHIPRMEMDCFYRFEREIYAAGAGKDGLIIDVRENPGGFIADHLLTVLCQPQHAFTVDRGSRPGYPQDRMVYASWNKPIVVLCNQNSCSNAEIFSHAIHTLKRGKVVGVQTAGDVISTGATKIMDIGMLRIPFRGWFLIGDGQDMELNGAMPDYVVWPEPCEMPAGVDRQLSKAVEVLKEEVTLDKKRSRPKLKKASSR